MIRFNAPLLAAVSLAVSNEETRYYLNGVYLHDRFAVATNGHVMTVAHDPEALIEEPGIYPISKAAQSACRKKDADHVEIANGLLDVVRSESTYHTRAVLHSERIGPIDGTFPAYRNVIPGGKKEQGATDAAFSHIVLGFAAATAKALGAKDLRIVCPAGEANGPHLVRYGDREDVFSILMPMRRSAPATLPDWYLQPDQAAKPATDQAAA